LAGKRRDAEWRIRAGLAAATWIAGGRGVEGVGLGRAGGEVPGLNWGPRETRRPHAEGRMSEGRTWHTRGSGLVAAAYWHRGTAAGELGALCGQWPVANGVGQIKSLRIFWPVFKP
jgi:hypothetical protein